MDDVAGGQFAVEHLIEQGWRRIAFLGVTALEIRAPRCAAR